MPAKIFWLFLKSDKKYSMNNTKMSKDTFTEEENREFIRLLKKIQANGYWQPLEIFKEMQKTVSRWCTELIIIDSLDEDKPKALLYRYDEAGLPEHQGKFGLHGGFEKFSEDEVETVNRIAQEELDIKVEYLGLIGYHKWTIDEHPRGARIMSLYALCKPLNKIELSDNRRFFTREEMLALDPDDMDPEHPHRKFLDKYLAMLKIGKEIKPIK